MAHLDRRSRLRAANERGTGIIMTFSALPLIAAIVGIAANLALMLPLFM
jgi:hypothetical protein